MGPGVDRLTEAHDENVAGARPCRPAGPGLGLRHEDRAVLGSVLAHGEWGGGDLASAYRRAPSARSCGAGLQRHLSTAAGSARSSRGAPLAQRAVLPLSRRAVGVSSAA